MTAMQHAMHTNLLHKPSVNPVSIRLTFLSHSSFSPEGTTLHLDMGMHWTVALDQDLVGVGEYTVTSKAM